jgi:hypothetical protein
VVFLGSSLECFRGCYDFQLKHQVKAKLKLLKKKLQGECNLPYFKRHPCRISMFYLKSFVSNCKSQHITLMTIFFWTKLATQSFSTAMAEQWKSFCVIASKFFSCFRFWADADLHSVGYAAGQKANCSLIYGSF